MNMIEEMTGAADAQDEVAEVPYEKSGAFIGGLAGVVAGGVAGLVIGGITGAVTGGGGALSGALRGAMTGVLSGVALGGISGALIERKPKMALPFDADDEYVCDEKLLKEGVGE